MPELRILTWSAHPQHFVVQFLAETGREYTLERSTDMKVWGVVAALQFSRMPNLR
jgi:hypothetical protein